MSGVRFLLDRAVAAEQRADELAEENRVLRGRLRAALTAEPMSAALALGYRDRAHTGERLIGEALDALEASHAPPPGWEARARALVHAARITRELEVKMMGDPDDRRP